jgi:hypothetical protein
MPERNWSTRINFTDAEIALFKACGVNSPVWEYSQNAGDPYISAMEKCFLKQDEGHHVDVLREMMKRRCTESLWRENIDGVLDELGWTAESICNGD